MEMNVQRVRLFFTHPVIIGYSKEAWKGSRRTSWYTQTRTRGETVVYPLPIDHISPCPTLCASVLFFDFYFSRWNNLFPSLRGRSLRTSRDDFTKTLLCGNIFARMLGRFGDVFVWRYMWTAPHHCRVARSPPLTSSVWKHGWLFNICLFL